MKKQDELTVLRRARQILDKGFARGTWIRPKQGAAGRAFRQRVEDAGLVSNGGLYEAHQVGERRLGGVNEQDFACCGQGAIGVACGELGHSRGEAHKLLVEIDRDLIDSKRNTIVATNDQGGKKKILEVLDEQIAKREGGEAA